MKSLRNWNAIALVLIAPFAARAHDFWIEPDTFRPEPDSVLRIVLRVGEEFVGEAVKRDGDKIRKFVVVGPGGESPIMGMDGTDPAGVVRVTAPGIYVIGYRSNHSYIELPAEKFENYLLAEGLRDVIEFRKQRGESDGPGREIYSRCAKALVSAGRIADGRSKRNPLVVPGSGSPAIVTSATGGVNEATTSSVGFDRNLGLTLEIVPMNNPATLKVGEELKVRLLFEGAPLEASLVTFMSKAAPEDAEAKRTDKDGVVMYRLNKPGMWLVKSVHMIRSFDASVADWESFWASLTFELRADDSSAP